MDTLFLYNTKTLKEKFKTKVFAGDNHITKINVQIPDNIGGYPKRECEFNLRAIISEGNMSYIINPNEPYFYITNDITETAQTVRLMMIITHAGNVIGRTNTVGLVVNEPAEAPDPPLTPREEFDEVIAEQRAEIAEQAETISEQATAIEAKDGQISELNDEITEKDGQITELNTENARLENLTDTQRETIQNMLDNPPQPKLYTPPVVTPSGSVQQINPPTGYDGLNNAVVDRVSAEGVNFHSEWYKEGKECLGKVGTYNPFPERSYGGIYYTELGEKGYPKKILIKDMLRSASIIPQFFNTSNDAKRELREVIFENCPGFLTTAASLFQGLNYLTKVLLPDSLTSIGVNVFNNCTSLTEINLPDSLTSIGAGAFSGCASLTELTLPDPLTSIGQYAFNGCTSLTELTLTDSLTSIGAGAFQNCTSLTNLTLAQGFNCNGLKVSDSTRFTAETIVSCLEALADRTGQTAYTITFGSTNLKKLTAEQKAIATNKNWNLA